MRAAIIGTTAFFPPPDLDAQAYVNNLTGTYSTSELEAIHNFVSAMKIAGLWATREYIHLYCAKNSADALLDMKGDFNASITGTVSHTPNQGFNFSGSTSNLVDSGYNPSIDGINIVGGSTPSGSISVYERTAITNFSWYIAGSQSNSDLLIIPRISGNAWGRALVDANIQVAVPDALGLYSVSCLSTTNRRFHKNGTLLGSSLSDHTPTLPNSNLVVGSVGGNNPAHQIAYSDAGAGMNDTQAANHFAAVESLLDAFGAGVIA